jgi:hypothetical protein
LPRVELSANLGFAKSQFGKGFFAERPIFDSQQRGRPSVKLLCPIVAETRENKGKK